MNPKTKRGKELTAKRLKARYLIVVEGYNQKEAAKETGVSKVTMCKWMKRFKWDAQLIKGINKEGGLSAIMEDFFEYVENEANSTISKDLKGLWHKYDERLKSQFATSNP